MNTATRRRDRLHTAAICLTLLLFGLMLAVSGQTAAAVRDALALCGKTLIPALFPFMVLSGILFRIARPKQTGRRPAAPVARLFGIRPVCLSAVTVGLLCGFPAGAAAAYRLWDDGLCETEDFRRTVLLSSSAAPGFVIAGVGGGMLGSPRKGLLLWLIQVVSLLAVGLLYALLHPRKTDLSPLAPRRPPNGLLSAAAESLRESAVSMLSVCAAVVFFSAPAALLGALPLPDLGRVLLTGGLELTNGVFLASSLLPPSTAFLVCGALIGWSGLSVHAQTVLVTKDTLPLSSYLIGKALTALFTAFFSAIALSTGLL